MFCWSFWSKPSTLIWSYKYLLCPGSGWRHLGSRHSRSVCLCGELNSLWHGAALYWCALYCFAYNQFCKNEKAMWQSGLIEWIWKPRHVSGCHSNVPVWNVDFVLADGPPKAVVLLWLLFLSAVMARFGASQPLLSLPSLISAVTAWLWCCIPEVQQSQHL